MVQEVQRWLMITWSRRSVERDFEPKRMELLSSCWSVTSISYSGHREQRLRQQQAQLEPGALRASPVVARFVNAASVRMRPARASGRSADSANTPSSSEAFHVVSAPWHWIGVDAVALPSIAPTIPYAGMTTSARDHHHSRNGC